jgi:hypothetical protein
MQAIPIQTTCVSLKFAYRCTSPIFREIGETGGNLAINTSTIDTGIDASGICAKPGSTAILKIGPTASASKIHWYRTEHSSLYWLLISLAVRNAGSKSLTNNKYQFLLMAQPCESCENAGKAGCNIELMIF